MQPEILSQEQQELLPFIAKFRRIFYLVGGTAIALQLGHRRSVDFDLFTGNKIIKLRIQKMIFGQLYSEKLFREQLAFHNDIDYSEQIEYMPGCEVPEKQIKDFLIDISLQGF